MLMFLNLFALVMASANLFPLHAWAFISKNNPSWQKHSRRMHHSIALHASKISELPSYWERLNKPKTVMAPMVAQSDLPFRHLCRKYDIDLCFTQMIHATNLIRCELFQEAYLDVYRYDEECSMSPSGLNALKELDWNDWLERFPDQEELTDLLEEDEIEKWSAYQEGDGDAEINPLIVQLAGHEPKVMSEAAQVILGRTNDSSVEGEYSGPVSGIDINCGCPQGIARKGRYGAFLMEESVDIVCDIVSTLRRDLPSNVGISCKIRIPENVGEPVGDAVLKERICKLIDAGVDLITIHGRTVKENKTKVRECNWDAIAKAVKIAREHSGDSEFPIISNGGIEFTSDVSRCLEATGASAVMSSEALLENPGLFKIGAADDVDLSPKFVFERQVQFCHEYLDFCALYPPLPGSLGKVGGSFNCIRTHLFKLLYRYLGEQPDLRADLGHPTKITSIQATRSLLHELERRHDIKEYDWNNLKSSDTVKKSWYRRHRDAITSSKMRTRGGQTAESELNGLSIEEKKVAMRKRLKKIKDQRASSKLINM